MSGTRTSGECDPSGAAAGRSRATRLWVTALLGSSVVACGAHHQTQRVFNGRTVHGHYIEPAAYAAYTEGSYSEARGELDAAERAYERALDHDPHGAPIWVRLGVLRCRASLEAALEAFDRAVQEDGSAGWTERARCLDQHRARDRALQAARRAIALDPEGSDANLLYADLLIGQGQGARASAWLFAWLCFAPDAAAHWRAVDERSRQVGDALLARLARDRANPWSTATEAPHVAPTESAVKTALLDGDVDTARLRASAAGSSLATFAQIALSSGRADLALAEAETVLGADPTNGDALTAALFAAAALGDLERLQRLLRGPGAVAAEAPSAAAAALLHSLITWFAGEHEAEAWAAARAAATQPAAP